MPCGSRPRHQQGQNIRHRPAVWRVEGYGIAWPDESGHRMGKANCVGMRQRQSVTKARGAAVFAPQQAVGHIAGLEAVCGSDHAADLLENRLG